MNRWMGLWVLPLLVLMGGCGDDDNAAPFNEVTLDPDRRGVASETKLQDLDDRQVGDLCEEVTAQTQRLLQTNEARYCAFVGGLAGALAAGFDLDGESICRQARQGCQIPNLSATPCEMALTDAMCSATVGEYWACADEQIRVQGQIYGELDPSLSCQELIANPAATELDPPLSEDCETLRTQCPELFMLIMEDGGGD